MNYLMHNGELYHYGLKGMKWGQRRWQYDDGRFNDAGKERYFGQKSSHRPDSVRMLQGDPPKQKGAKTVKSSSIGKKEFDKEKAKKIAKGVAIGAAVVGGTLLVAYGAKQIHDLGGVSEIAKNAATKASQVKLDAVKSAQQTKVEIAKIRSDYKQQAAKIREETKTDLKKIYDEGKENLRKIRNDAKLERRINGIDSTGALNRDVIKKELLRADASAESMWKNSYGAISKSSMSSSRKSIDNFTKSMVSDLTPSEVKRLNSGEVSLRDIRIERSLSSPESVNARYASMNNKRSYGIAKSVADSVKNIKAPNLTPVQKVVGTANAKTKNVVNKIKHMSLPKLSGKQIASGARFIAQTAKTAKQTKQNQKQQEAEIVRMYKQEHPNTKLSDKKILKNYQDMMRG